MRDVQNRVLILVGTVTLTLLLLGFQLYRLTVAESAIWASRATEQTLVPYKSHGPRGFIFDRSGRPLATSEPIEAAVLIDQDPELVERILPKLALLLAEGDKAEADRIVASVNERVAEHQRLGLQSEEIQIKSHLSTRVVTEFTERKGEFPGVALVTQSARRYPQGPIASPILGYVGRISEEDLASPTFEGYLVDSVVGKDGLERFYEQVLQGRMGTREKIVDSSMRPVGVREEVPARPGDNLYLTLDLDLQRVAEEALAKNLEQIAARGKAEHDSEVNPIRGSLVAIEVKTGAVLAMAQVPTFNPNHFVTGDEAGLAQIFQDPRQPLLNWSMVGFEPGSTYKMGVGLAGTQLGEIGLKETVHCNTTYFRDPTRKNWYPFDQGNLSLDMALAQSCNPYFYEAGYRVGIDRLADFLSHFGFGKQTGIDLPGESAGILPTQASYEAAGRWNPGNILSVAIGQGDVRVTPLQLAVYTATIANSGVRYQPYLVAEVRDSDGQLVQKREPVQVDLVEAAPEVWKEVQLGMWKGANHPLGTAYTPFVGFPVTVAAKTGSAETGREYANGLTVLYAPYDDPQIAIAVVVEGAGHGSWVAPAARAVLAQYFGIQDQGPNTRPAKAD